MTERLLPIWTLVLASPEPLETVTSSLTASKPAQRRPSPKTMPLPPATWFFPEKKRQGRFGTRPDASRTTVSALRLASPLAPRVPPEPVELLQPELLLPALPQGQAVPLSHPETAARPPRRAGRRRLRAP